MKNSCGEQYCEGGQQDSNYTLHEVRELLRLRGIRAMVQAPDRFQALEHTLDLFFILGTQQRIARRWKLPRGGHFAQN